MPIAQFEGNWPTLGQNIFIAPSAWVTGRTEIGENSSIFFGAALRGDINKIIIGHSSNVQDNAVIHTSDGLGDCVIGDYVSIGHAAILHGCKVQNRCIIGMGATLLDEAVIGEDSVVGANSLVTMRTIIPPRSLVMGSPAKVVRELRPEEIENIMRTARRYIGKSAEYMRTLGAGTNRN
jgi:carbonic anhydrase/acetyltransferase-like protein (isoleucine patch superfamily)